MNLCQIISQQAPESVTLHPTVVELPGDLETPVSAYLKLEPIGARFLLESAENPKAVGRYTFIGISPTHRIDLFREFSRVQGVEGT